MKKKRVGKIRGREGEEIFPSRTRKRGARGGGDVVEEGERQEDKEGRKEEEGRGCGGGVMEITYMAREKVVKRV